ncbi:DnaJ domain-containing protein [Reichenbachiella versicolor]|uniref:DnaJ domain-containing protein n=1 Tax=Reichenbachiella versicolor TaxID=1821036 RepID=UPI000D6E5D2F|nr:DnaJ domain-containing protein [Reichenbachiella versicolor]
MREHYLNILNLHPSATEDEIKSAYRKLSKRYHPDLNQAADAKSKFIEIKEAYDYLTSPQPKYIDTPSHYEDPREVFKREYMRKKREEKIQQQQMLHQMMVKCNKYFRSVAVIILIFNLLLAADYLLPRKEYLDKIIGFNKVFERSGGGKYSSGTSHYRYDDIYFQKYQMRFEGGEIIGHGTYLQEAVVLITPIFSKPMTVMLNINGHQEAHHQLYNIYNFFGYIIPVTLLCICLFFYLKRPSQAFNTSIILVVCGLFELVLFFVV